MGGVENGRATDSEAKRQLARTSLSAEIFSIAYSDV